MKIQDVLEVSAFCLDANVKKSMPLLDGTVDNALIIFIASIMRSFLGKGVALVVNFV